MDIPRQGPLISSKERLEMCVLVYPRVDPFYVQSRMIQFRQACLIERRCKCRPSTGVVRFLAAWLHPITIRSPIIEELRGISFTLALVKNVWKWGGSHVNASVR